jgi:hypothetical protein
MTTFVKRDFTMKQQITARTACCFLALGVAGLAPFGAQATVDQWHWDLAIYGWFPGTGDRASTTRPA